MNAKMGLMPDREVARMLKGLNSSNVALSGPHKVGLYTDYLQENIVHCFEGLEIGSSTYPYTLYPEQKAF